MSPGILDQPSTVALQEALRIKEKKEAEEVVAVTIGPKQSQDTLRTALAMGADRGIHVHVDDDAIAPLTVAKLLAAVARNEQPSMFMLGKQAIDDDSSQTGQMLAALLEWPQGTFASKIILDCAKTSVNVTREVDGGLETLRLSLPAVITTDLRLNEPRYATLANIMKAKKKRIDVTTPEELNVNIVQDIETLQVEEPAKRKAGVILQSVSELVNKLKNEAKVI